MWRKKRKLSQHKLADLVEMSYSHLNEIELGKRNIQATTIYRLALCLQINPAVLFLNRDQALSVAKQLGMDADEFHGLVDDPDEEAAEPNDQQP